MAKFLFCLSIGYSNARQEEEIDVEMLDGLTEDQKEEFMEEQLRVWSNNFIEKGYGK